MVDFWAVATSPVAVNKFFHTVLSGWVLGALFVVGVSAWFLLKKRHKEFALQSIKIGAMFGLVSTLLSAWTGDGSGYQVAKTQPMKLAAWKDITKEEKVPDWWLWVYSTPTKRNITTGKILLSSV
jgi:cytochrome d ubiquinol oxidase subunit I